MKDPDLFWSWFQENCHHYASLDDHDEIDKERLLNELEEQLHLYSPGIYFQIGEAKNENNELIITAEGNVDYFADVEQLIENAPAFKGWTFIPFSSAVSGEMVLQWDDIKLDTKDIYFNPLRNPSNAELGIMVYLKEFAEDQEDEFYNATFKLLENILGEKSFALDIAHIGIKNQKEYPVLEDLIAITKLPAYLKWHKSKYKS